MKGRGKHGFVGIVHVVSEQEKQKPVMVSKIKNEVPTKPWFHESGKQYRSTMVSKTTTKKIKTKKRDVNPK